MKTTRRPLISIALILMFSMNLFFIPGTHVYGFSKKKAAVGKVPKKIPAKPAKKSVVKKTAPIAAKQAVKSVELSSSKLKEYINEDNIMKIIEDLSSPRFEGRATGTEGNKLAAQYIADYFKKIGLTSPKGAPGYKQYYRQEAGILNSKPVVEILDQDGKLLKAFQYRLDFTPFLYQIYGLKGDATKELYVVSSKKDFEDNLSTFKDKILVISSRLSSELVELPYYMASMGLNALVESDYTRNGDHYLSSVYHPGEKYQGEKSGLYFRITSSMYRELNELAATVKGSRCHISHDMTLETVAPANVIGMIPGSSQSVKNECIVLSAHFDHLGNNYDGTYNNGAFDNASGVAVVMELARVMKMQNLKPDKTIVFAAFNGEETGLIGSREFIKSGIINLDHAVNINFDMVGFSGDAPYRVYGGNYNPTPNALRDELASFLEENGIPSITGDFPASDHVSFANAGIPAAFIFDEVMTTYHSPDDTAVTLDKYEIENIAALALKYVFSAPFKKPFAYK